MRGVAGLVGPGRGHDGGESRADDDADKLGSQSILRYYDKYRSFIDELETTVRDRIETLNTK